MSDTIEQGQRVLRAFEAFLRTNLGRDDKHSGFLNALERYVGVDPLIIELVQDSGILVWKVLRVIRRNLHDPDNIGPELLLLVGDIPEIIRDAKALKAKG